MKKVKYLNNRDLLAQIHKSKTSYCSYVSDDDSQHDLIVSGPKKINAGAIAKARKNRAKRLTQEAWLEAKLRGEKKIKLSNFTVSTRKIDKTELVFRVSTYDHIPLDSERKRNPKSESDKHIKVNFPPFQHYKINKKGKLYCVGKSHWIGGMDNGYFSSDHGKITNSLALMFMKLCERYGTRANWRGYTYNDEMQSQALMQLSQIGLQFDESKSENPFAYYTAAITNSFTRILNIEKKNQNIRDDLLEQHHMMPSSTRQAKSAEEATLRKKTNLHGPVKIVNKTAIKELNKKLRKKGKLSTKDFETARYKEFNREDLPRYELKKKRW